MEELNNKSNEDSDNFAISDIYEESPDGIIEKLFKSEDENNKEEEEVKEEAVW